MTGIPVDSILFDNSRTLKYFIHRNMKKYKFGTGESFISKVMTYSQFSVPTDFFYDYCLSWGYYCCDQRQIEEEKILFHSQFHTAVDSGYCRRELRDDTSARAECAMYTYTSYFSRYFNIYFLV